MITRLIQRQVPIGSQIRFTLKTGKEIAGVLTEIGLSHVILESNGKLITIVVETISTWEILENEGVEFNQEKLDEKFTEVERTTTHQSAEAVGEQDASLTNPQLEVKPAEVEEITSGQPVEVSSEQVTLSADPQPDVMLTKVEGSVNNPAERLTEQVTSPTDLQLEIFKKLIEIEARFQAQLQTAKIELRPPDFNVSPDEFKSWQKTNVATIWNRIKNQYDYAQKVNELGAKFGRIQPIISDLKSLTVRFPASACLKRHLAYFCFLSGNQQEALQCYQNAAMSSQEPYDWFNLAGLALKSGREELACYSLEQGFYQISITKELEAWYVYVNLLKKFSNYSALGKLCETAERSFSEDEIAILFETGIYLLKVTDKEEQAKEKLRKWIEGQPLKSLVLEVFNQLEGQPVESYRRVVTEFLNTVKERERKTQPVEPQQPGGYIYTYGGRDKYGRERNFGFLRDLKGDKYFFHRSAVIDDTLLNKLNNFTGKQIPVVFETAEGPKGPLAIQISLYRTIDELFKLANDHANEGEYAKAITQIKQVIAFNPDYPHAQELYEKWREYARVSGVPRGSNPYARAKRVQLIEKDLERAAQLLREAIKRNDNVESAIKDLAQLLVQLGRPEVAVNVLEQNRKKIQDQQSLDNLFVNIYQNAGLHKQAITLLRKNLERTSNEEKKAQILWQIANSYLRQEDFKNAEQVLKQVLRLRPDNIPAQRNLALCLSKQERYEEAEEILNQILNTSSDGKSAELLEAITRAKITGESAQVDEIIIETALSDFSGELSGYTQFFLSRCNFEGVAPDRVKEGRYAGSEKYAQYDIERLEDIAKQFGTRRPRDRASYYLSAARISLDIGGDRDLFYRYLCRSFASRGDIVVIENRNLDTAREWYCEALRVYDGCRQQDEQKERYDEQDAVNALSRFLFSYLGRNEIPTSPPEQDEKVSILKQQLQYVDNTVEAVISKHPQRDRVFDAITYLVLHSKYAANRILNRLYAKPTLQALALEYLKNRGISALESIRSLDDFVHLWNELRRKQFDKVRTISSELRFLANVELATAWLQNGIEQTKSIYRGLFFDLDQQRVQQLQRILEAALEFCKQVTFEERERLCIQIDGHCQDLLGEIENSPTKISIEEIYPVVEVLQKKVRERLEELYETSKPQLTLRLPVESYVPDSDLRIEVQIVVENKMGRSPAESLELILQEDENFFTVTLPEIKLDESLRGGEQRILKVPLRMTDQALQSQTFSLTLYAQYRTRSGEIEQTSIDSFSIRLYPEEEFKEVENPYAAYAEGGIVGEPEMFFGREELIENIARAIQKSHTQSKCVIVFGQKRSGKSSILYHLKRLLEKDKGLMVLDIGNIGSILDPHSSTPLLYQILWSILKNLRDAIEDRVENGSSPVNLSFPSDREFYVHPSPLVFFKDMFDKYKRTVSKREDWCNIRIVILIDEFSYIYGQIVADSIPESFMKNWKALLQENYFNAVLAGQDVIPKFKQRFPNEFGTTQDERVTYLKQEDAIKLIDEPIRIGGRQGESRYRERAIERILNLTAGSPFYIQIICNRLVEYMNRKHARLVTEADVEQVKNDLIRGVNALSLDKFDNLINSGDTSKDAIPDEDALKVLKAISVNSQTGPCNRNNITCETSLSIDVILDDLVKRDVIERDREHYYQIRVGLFKEWLIANR